MVCVSMCSFRITYCAGPGTKPPRPNENVYARNREGAGLLLCCRDSTPGYRSHRYGTVSYRNVFPGMRWLACDPGHTGLRARSVRAGPALVLAQILAERAVVRALGQGSGVTSASCSSRVSGSMTSARVSVPWTD